MTFGFPFSICVLRLTEGILFTRHTYSHLEHTTKYECTKVIPASCSNTRSIHNLPQSVICSFFVEENLTRIPNETHANENILPRKTHFGRIHSTIIEYNVSYYKTGNIDILLISSRNAHTSDAWLHQRAEIQRLSYGSEYDVCSKVLWNPYSPITWYVSCALPLELRLAR